jgi:hypothetical protein
LLGLVVALSVLAFATACGPSGAAPNPATTPFAKSAGGVDAMDRKDSIAESLVRSSQDEVPRIADKAARDAREPARAAVQLWIGPDQAMSNKAMSLILNMRELAIAPLTDVEPRTPADKASAVLMAVDAELAQRAKLIRRIDALLDDKREIPMLAHGLVEEEPPQRRVCDEAYELMGRLIRFGEEDIKVMMDAHTFLRLSDKQKDAIIAKARASGTWERAFHADEAGR